jgi:hypothetical protein
MLAMLMVVVKPLQPLQGAIAQLHHRVAEDMAAEPLQGTWLHA